MVLQHAAPSPGHLVAARTEERLREPLRPGCEGEKAAPACPPGVGEGPGEEKAPGWLSQGCQPGFHPLPSALAWLSVSV